MTSGAPSLVAEMSTSRFFAGGVGFSRWDEAAEYASYLRDNGHPEAQVACVPDRRCFWCRRWALDLGCRSEDDLEYHEKWCDDRPDSEKDQ